MDDEANNRSEGFRHLRRSLRRLATAGAEQAVLFSDLVSSAQDLASDYDQAAAAVRADYESELSAAQAEALTAIDKKLVTMSRDGDEFDADLWTDTAVRTGEDWAELRILAVAALDAFGWPNDSPPAASDEDQESGVET
jgi:hypothetical protein